MRNPFNAPLGIPLPPPPPQLNPEFLIIGLFALRLAKRLIASFEHYPSRDTDVAWLTNFLAPYPLEFALAKISGARRYDYIAVYRGIISRMKKQPRYPIHFMLMNPGRLMQQQQRAGGEAEREQLGDMTDRKSCVEVETWRH